MSTVHFSPSLMCMNLDKFTQEITFLNEHAQSFTKFQDNIADKAIADVSQSPACIMKKFIQNSSLLLVSSLSLFRWF